MHPESLQAPLVFATTDQHPLGLEVPGFARAFDTPADFVNQFLSVSWTDAAGERFVVEWENGMVLGDSDRTLVVTAADGRVMRVTMWLQRSSGLGRTVRACVKQIETLY